MVPDHLRDKHYKGAEKLGRGINYLYPHDFPNHWVAQDYLPERLKSVHYYEAEETGKYEQALKMRLEQIKEWKKCAKH